MKYSQYKFKFYINANHAIYLNGVLGKNHPHTWEITIDTIKVRDDFIQFDIIRITSYNVCYTKLLRHLLVELLQ